jgi:hypothetical protein
MVYCFCLHLVVDCVVVCADGRGIQNIQCHHIDCVVVCTDGRGTQNIQCRHIDCVVVCAGGRGIQNIQCRHIVKSSSVLLTSVTSHLHLLAHSSG